MTVVFSAEIAPKGISNDKTANRLHNSDLIERIAISFFLKFFVVVKESLSVRVVPSDKDRTGLTAT